eukprot:766457-Hanusia_phi.AAC.15
MLLGRILSSKSYQQIRSAICFSIFLQSVRQHSQKAGCDSDLHGQVFLLAFVDKWTPRRIILLDVGVSKCERGGDEEKAGLRREKAFSQNPCQLGLGGLLRVVLQFLERNSEHNVKPSHAAPRNNTPAGERSVERSLIIWRRVGVFFQLTSSEWLPAFAVGLPCSISLQPSTRCYGVRGFLPSYLFLKAPLTSGKGEVEHN